MKKTLYQRFLALMLASVMVLGMCPVPSFAAAGEGGGSSSFHILKNVFTSSSRNAII